MVVVIAMIGSSSEPNLSIAVVFDVVVVARADCSSSFFTGAFVDVVVQVLAGPTFGFQFGGGKTKGTPMRGASGMLQVH